jgi:hypothetical protein
MDSLTTAAARALAAGDALGALKHVALRDDPPALALRGIAMAQLGEHPRARELLKRAARGFGAQEALARARCVVAEAEIAFAMRDLSGTPRALNTALATLEAHDDRANAVHARLIAVRKLLLLGQLDAAQTELAKLNGSALSPVLATTAEMASAELDLRALNVAPERAALDRAHAAAQRAGVPALLAEVEDARSALTHPAARRLSNGDAQALRLDEVAELLDAHTLVIDGCRRGICAGAQWQPLARRPVLFSLAQALAEAWPGDIDRETLIERAFNTRQPDETHRARLRVELGRLRALLKTMARIVATSRGFILQPLDGREVALLAPLIDGEQASLIALLSDGAAWSTSALALAMNASQRTVQRALAELEAEGRVRAIGRTRTRRWLAPPLAGYTTILLLPAAMQMA